MDQNRNILFIILFITFSGFNTQLKHPQREILSNEEILKNIEKILVNANQNISQIEISIKGTSKKTECCACPPSPSSTTSTTPPSAPQQPTYSTTTTTTVPVPTCISTKPAIIVSGGWPNKKSVELYHSNFTHWLTLPNLIDDRAAHTQNGLLACGGTYSGQNCETLNLGVNTWKEFALDIDRHYHTSWSRPSGAILFGGWSHEAQISAVKVTGTKHSTAFSLNDETYGSCAIELPTKVIISGGAMGAETIHDVHVYNDKGFVGSLAPLKQGRRDHACGYYKTSKGTEVYIVVAGLDWPNYLDSTEMFDGSSWNYVKSAKFPHRIDGIRGISIDNKIYVTGGHNGHKSYNFLFQYDNKQEKWEKLNEVALVKERAYHAVSLLDVCSLTPLTNESYCGCKKEIGENESSATIETTTTIATKTTTNQKEWMNWSPWSSCTKTCGGGNQMRTRK